MKREKFTGILKKDVLDFKNNNELKKYYEKKYKNGGYRGGYILFGINFSKIFHNERQESAFKLINSNKKEIILDAGCGRGDLTFKLSKRCKKIYGIDIAKNSLNKKYRKVKNLIFKQMNIEELKFNNNYFDKIVCVETLEHLINPERAIVELKRVLKKEGILVITYPTLNKTFMHLLESKLKLRKNFPISEHLSEWSYNNLINMFKKEGFELIESEGICFDFGILGRIKTWSKNIALSITKLSLKIRSFPRNSSFISIKFRKSN